MKLPAGTTIITGQFAHSLNVAFGLSAFSCIGDSGAASVDAAGAGVGVTWAGGDWVAVCACVCPSATNKQPATMQEHVAAIARPCAMGPPLPTTAPDRLKNTLDWAWCGMVALSKWFAVRSGSATDFRRRSSHVCLAPESRLNPDIARLPFCATKRPTASLATRSLRPR